MVQLFIGGAFVILCRYLGGLQLILIGGLAEKDPEKLSEILEALGHVFLMVIEVLGNIFVFLVMLNICPLKLIIFLLYNK